MVRGMSKKSSKKRRGFLDTIFGLAEKAIDGYNDIINRIQDRILNLTGNMEKVLKGEKSSKDEELKEYMKVSIKDIERKEIDSDISVKPAEKIEEIKIPTEEKISLPAEEKEEGIALPSEEKEEEISLPAEEKEDLSSEEDVKRMLIIYGIDREKALILIKNDIKTVYKLASEVPSKISRLLNIPVVEAQNVIRAANAMIF